MREHDFVMVRRILDAFEQFVNGQSSGINGPFRLDDVRAAVDRIEHRLRESAVRFEPLGDWIL